MRINISCVSPASHFCQELNNALDSLSITQHKQINMQIRKMVFYGYSSLIEGLQAGEVTADTNIYDYLLSRPGTYPRYNPTVFGDSETFISMVDHATTFDDLKYFSNTEGTNSETGLR